MIQSFCRPYRAYCLVTDRVPPGLRPGLLFAARFRGLVGPCRPPGLLMPQSVCALLCFGFFFVCVTGTGRANAATIDDYRSRLSHALVSIQQLQVHGGQDPTQQGQFNASMLAQLRAEVPANETVFFDSQSFAVDNTWLHEALREYETAKGDNSRHNQMLAHIGERLLAIIERLDEMKTALATADKDQSKARLAEILRRPEYNKGAAEGSALERLWERFLRWLSSLFPKTKPLQPGSARVFSGIAQIIISIVCLGAIVFFIWKFAPRYLRNRGKKKKKREARIVLGERLEPDQTSSDLLAQAESLARAGDLRAAIRKAYIALLCELGDRKIISLAQHKTNRDYLGALRNRPSLYTPMSSLTNSFELHWYGFVPAGENDWIDFRNTYQQVLKTS